MVAAQRAFSPVLINGDWIPVTPEIPDKARAHGVFASRFELADVTFWTLINRHDEDFEGVVLHSEDHAATKIFVPGLTVHVMSWPAAENGATARPRVAPIRFCCSIASAIGSRPRKAV